MYSANTNLFLLSRMLLCILASRLQSSQSQILLADTHFSRIVFCDICYCAGRRVLETRPYVTLVPLSAAQSVAINSSVESA